MRLKDIFSQLKRDSLGEIVLSGISDDSRTVSRRDLFFIVPGRDFNIFSVLAKIEPKVSAFVAQKSIQKRVQKLVKHKPVIYVDNIKKELIKAADKFYQLPNDQLKIIGVTGTNGKTTTCYLIYHILTKLGLPTSLITTVNYHIGSKVYKPTHTTPGFLALRKLIWQAADSGSHFLVIEVSSHAIDQERIKGINFHRCLFTNLSRDHLDYHKTVDSYFKAKQKLFLDNKKAVSLINIDDAYGIKLFRRLPKSLTYGAKAISDFRITNANLTKTGSRFDIEYLNKGYSFKTNLCGQHNIYNLTTAFGLVASLGILRGTPLGMIAEAAGSFNGVEGRLEQIGANIFVDYAHTPDALETTLLALRNIGYENIICVFGCGGNRDKGKRKLMGRVASKQADFSFITSDNPRSENPKFICRQIEKGFPTSNYTIVIDRKQAIKKALCLFAKDKANGSKTGKGSCLLVAGKGHEDYQIIGSKAISFKDSAVVREIIKNGKCFN